MNGLVRMVKVGAIVIGLSVATGGCASVRDRVGYVGDPLLIAGVRANIDTKESVTKTLGRPTMVSQFDPQIWYYISRETKQLYFTTPKPTKQQVLLIRFNDDGVVSEIRNRGLDQVAEINPEQYKTPTMGNKTGFIKDLFGNIGTVGAVSRGGGTADNPN